SGELSDLEQAKFLKDSPDLSRDDYLLLLKHINRDGDLWADHLARPRIAGTPVFPHCAREHKALRYKGRQLSVRTAHESRSCIFFKEPGRPQQRSTGFITRIWTVLLPPRLHIILLVERHRPFRRASDRTKGPFHTHPHFQTKIIPIGDGDPILLQPEDIIAQCVVWRRPKGLYKISEDFYVINHGTHRNR
ncbi:hypothetical protein EXIGLDRAFT_563104, partial [Exidia glandulosa HHB12029]